MATLSCLTLALGAALVQPLVASASPTNPYVIDGSVIPDTAAADGELTDLFGAVKELGPKNASNTKIGVINKAAAPMLDYTNPNAQVDLRKAWLDLQRDSENNDWVYFAWERDSNSGSGFIAFEFMKNGAPALCNYGGTDAALIAGCNPWKNRQAGDFLILWDQNGSSTQLYKRIWSGTAPNLTLGAPVAIVNGVAAFSADKFKGEAAVNLTAEKLSDPGKCVAFANVIPSTVTGNSDTADYKDTILDSLPPISNCHGTVVTTPKDGDGGTIGGGGLSVGTSGSVKVRDSAVVDVVGGSAPPTGSVTFSLCKVGDVPDVCDAGEGTLIGATPLSQPVDPDNTSYPVTVLSPPAWVTSAGRYCWHSSWSGDANNQIPEATETPEAAANECFTVNPVTPTLTTNASAGGVLNDATVTDTAHLGGTAPQPTEAIIHTSAPAAGTSAGGSITFTLYGPGDCSTIAYSATVNVSGDGDYSPPSFKPTLIGTYHWKAVYSGNLPNTTGRTHNADCTVPAEDVTITAVDSSMTTAQSWIPNDSATVSAPAGGNLAGSVTFTLYATANCSGPAVAGYSATRPVAGASPQTVGTSFTTAITTTGTTAYSWKVTWASTNPAQRGIANSCRETSSVTVTNGGTATSTTP